MNVSADRTEAEDIYNLGEASQQAEINKLKQDIKDLENYVGVLEDTISYAKKFIDKDKYSHAIIEIDRDLR